MCVSVCVYIHTHIDIHVNSYITTNMCMYIYIYTNTHTHKCVFVYLIVRAYTYTTEEQVLFRDETRLDHAGQERCILALRGLLPLGLKVYRVWGLGLRVSGGYL